MKRFTAFALILIMMICPMVLSSCAPDDEPDIMDSESAEAPAEESQSESEGSEVPEQPKYSQNSYALKDIAGSLKMLGRARAVSGGVECDLTATGVEFNAYISGNLTVKVNCSADTYFTVYIDGTRYTGRLQVTKTNNTFTVKTGNDIALRNIRIVKQTEAKNSICVIESISFYGKLDKAPENSKLYFEVIGDSISCGYGNLCTNGTSSPGSAAYQDGTQTYAYLAAEAAGADCSVISCSGIGVAKGYRDFVMSDFYPLVCRYRSQTENYDFARVPDAVIINLGTNDASKGANEAEFRAGVGKLIEDVRAAYKTDVPIVWCYGMMGDGCSYWIRSVISEMGGEEAGLYTAELPNNRDGGGGHPTLNAQIEASEVLLDYLKSKDLVK